MTTVTLPNSTTTTYYYNGSGVTLVNAGVQGAPGASGLNFGFVVGGDNDTLINNGTVFGQRVGVYVTGSGDGVTNSVGKQITATESDQAGVNFYNFSGTVTNYGTISGYANAVNGGPAGNAVQLRHGGLVTNFGTLLNGGVLVRDATGTVINSGVILGNNAYGGVYMNSGGAVTNLTSGVISANGATASYMGAPPYGIYIQGGAGTVTNAGTIDGSTGDAVHLATSYQNRVIVDPGAVFVGTVDGGTAADATLELASGASTGTLSSFGSQFTNFGTLTFDSSASWLLKTNTGITSSVVGGFAAGDTIDIAGFVAASDSFAGNALVLTDASNAHVTLHFQGTLTANNFTVGGDGGGGTNLIFDAGTVAGLAYGQTIDEVGILIASETVSAGVMTLRDSGNAIVGTIVVGTSLSSGDFTLTPDSGGTGTDVIVNTVFGTYTSGVTLLTSPTTIASTASINGAVANGVGVYGPSGTAWTLTNLGLVSETGANSDGVSFASAGTIVNATSATITGFAHGVVLNAGGSLTNQAGGTISGYDGITAQNASATVVNAGIITGDPDANPNDSAVGVALDAGGSVTNQSSGTISAFHYGVGISGAAGTVFNLGHINSGSVYNAIAGVYLLDGGEATNGQSGGTVSSAYIAAYRYAIRVGSGNAGTITNFGTLNGEGNVGARVVNGVIVNGPSGATGALIEGGSKAVLVDGTGTVVNYGTILGSESSGNGGTNYYGVKLDGAGSVANLGTASLIDAYIGVYGQSDDTVTNAGTILSGFGAGGVAVEFHGGTNRLIVDPGAIFTGSLNAAGSTTLELASAASAGTLTGSAITNFTSLVFDAGAQWTVAGSASASGFGTLSITGFTFGDTIDLTGFAAISRTFASDALVLTDSADAHVTLAIQSGLTTANFQISSDDHGGTFIDPQIIRNYGDTIDETGIVAASETVASGVMTLRDGGNAIVGTILVGPSLSSGDFTLQSDGVGGTDVIVSTVFGTYTNGVTLLTNPTTIASTANISAAGGNALFGAGVSPGWTINNYGVVNGGTNANGIQLGGDGSGDVGSGIITNAAGGTIAGRYGIRLYNSSTFSIVNLEGGTIVATGTNADRAIDMEGAAGTVTNAGLIIAQTSRPFDAGVELDGGGTVINTATGTIAGGFGVVVFGAGTVVNAGTISGVYHNEFAVALGGGDRLIVDPGAVFIGAVNGGFGGGSSTLELASAASAGTLTATNFTNFSTIEFDAGAAWTLAGATTALSGAIVGFTFGDTIDLIGFAAASATFASDTLVLTDGGGAHDTLHIQGSFAAGNFHLSSDGNAGTDIVFGAPPLLYGQTIDETGIVVTSETVTAGVMTLMNGTSAVGTIVVGPTLSTGDFILRPDGTSGTDVIVSSIFGTYTSGVTLAINPTSIVSTGSITGGVTSAIGVTGLSGTAWTLTNQGLVSETGAGSIGISFASNGSIINAGVVNGAATGIRLNAGGSVSNQSGGTISGVQGIYDRAAAATVVNSGSISGNMTSGSGIVINAGGSVTNLTGGTISGSYGINASSVAATVVNSGSIGDGTSLPTGAAIALKHGGQITNLAGGQIIAGLQGIYIGGAAGTIVNAGSVGGSPTSGNGVIFATVGAVTNQSGGVITGKYGVRAVSGAVAVTNAGSIGGNLASGGGVNLAAGGSVTNQSGGTITGQKAVLVTGGTVTNAGSIGGNTAIGTGAGVQLSFGGSFTNQSGGAVTGFAGVFSNGAATVVNAGSISGNPVSGRGVSLAGSGSVTNQAGGVINGFDGILAVGSATVVNAGSIGGVTAVAFGSGVTNRLVIDPGATFSGTVDGGNTIGAGLISTLELASGASAGTLSGLGSQFIDFASTTIDANSNWTLNGTNSLVAGALLTNSGTLTDTGTLFNSGTLAGHELRLSGGVLTNQASGVLAATYVYGVAAGGIDIVVNQGTIGDNTAAAIYLKASGTVTNAAGGAINGYGDGVRLSGAAASVSNLGQITGTSLLDNGYGVYLRNGGVVTNGQAGAGTSTASIRGNYGVTSKGAPATVGNYGTITGTGRTAVDLGNNGGSVVNGASGAVAALIEGGAYGVYTGAGSVTNYASIIATGIASHDYGVATNATGNVSNLGTASLIEGYGGVQIGTDGTVTNAGTIASNQGTSGVAVAFTDGNARLIDDPGAVFIGSIFGGTGGTAVMELASGSSAGTISGFDGIRIANFTSLVFDPGAAWTVAGNASATGLGGLGIAGFDVGDTIDLTGFVAVSRTFSSDSLVLTDSIGDHATLAIQSGFSTGNFRIAGDGGSGGAAGTDITLSAAVPPVITGTAAGQAVNDNATDQPFSAVMVSDANTGSQSETVTITVTEGGSATDADGTLSGIGLSKTGIGIYTVSASSAAAATAVLNALVFAPTTHQVVPGATVTTNFTLDDIDTAGAIASDSTTTVIATAVNDAPVVTGIVAGQTVADNATDQPFSATTISDPDAGAAETITITLTADGVASDANGLLAGTGLNKIGTGVYTLVAGTPVAATAALQALVFTPVAHEVPPGNSVITGMTLSVDDGIAGTPTTDATTTVVATAVNDAPIIAGTVGGQTVDDNGTDQPFLAATISDPDAGGTETVTITLTAGGVASDANGLLSGTGLNKVGTGVYVLAADTPAAVTAALQALVFTPAPHEVPPGGAVTTGMTLSVADGIAGTPTTDPTTTVVATALNDAPAIAGVAAGQTVNDNATDQPFSATTVSDPDAGAVEIVTITLTAGGAASDANGLLSGAGLSKTGAGVYVLAADTPAAVTAALRALVFTPVAHEVPPGSTVTTGMTLSVTDGIAGTPTTDATTTVVATAAFSLPSIGGTVPNQAVPNQTASTPFSAVVVTDPNFGATDTLTVTLSAPGNGIFTNLSGGSYDASTGIYNLTGTPVVLTAALEALVFTPLAQPGAFVTTTGFTLAIQGVGGTSSDSTTSVSTPQQILGLGTVPSNTLTFSVSPDGSSFAAPVSGMTNEAVVSNPVPGGTYTVPAGFQALFLDGTANATLSDNSVGNALLTANQGDDLLTANIAGDVLVAGSGTDTLVAGVGTATLIGGTGPNVMFAGSGSGIILGGAGASTVSGGSGPLTMFAGIGAIQAVGGVGSLVFVGGTSGGDTVSGGSGATTLAGGSGNNVLIGGSGTNLMSGGGGNDTMAGGSSASTLAGGGGNNILFGGSGSNVMFGGTGNATLAGGDGASTMDGSSGNNVIFGGIGPDVIFGGGGTDTIAGGAGQSTVSAGSGPMTVFAGSGAMLVFGGSGPLVFVGGATGGSTVVGGSGASTLFGGAGSDNTLFAGGGASTLVGGIGSTTMVGGSGDDVMFGGSGADSMFSGTGNAVMNAGSGADLFVFINGSAGGTDVISNFSHGPDQVALGNYAANVVPSVLAGAVTASGSTTITLSDNTRITFAGIAQLTASDFV